MGSNPSSPRYVHPNKPVHQVSWTGCAMFCNSLSEREGLVKCYHPNGTVNLDVDGYRLLTEAEWEYAWELGYDWHGSYKEGPVADPVGPPIDWWFLKMRRAGRRTGNLDAEGPETVN